MNGIADDSCPCCGYTPHPDDVANVGNTMEEALAVAELLLLFMLPLPLDLTTRLLGFGVNVSELEATTYTEIEITFHEDTLYGDIEEDWN